MSPTAIPGNLVLQSPTANDPLLDLNTQPSLDLQFATSKTLDDRVSGLPLVNHQRDASSGKSAGTYVGSDGLIKTSPVNLLTYSEQFDQGAWTKVNSTITPNSTTSPDGTLSADTFTINSGAVFARIDRRNLGLASNVYTLSYYLKNTVKQGTHSIEFYDSSLNGFVAVPSGIVGESNPEWRRIIATVDCSASGLSGLNEIRLNFRPSPSPSDGTNTVDLWGAQLQEGALTDYIPTTSTISGAPRFDHDPVTGESLGLLIEESRTNLAKYSEPDDRSTPGVSGEWYFFDLDPNTEITKVEGPDGVSNSASEMQLATGNNYDTQVRQVVVSPAQKYTFSAWVKLGTATNFALHVNDTTAWDTVPDGTYSFDANDGLNTNTFVKVSHTFTAPSTGSVNVSIGRHGATAPVQQTQGTVTVWGCQLELGAFSSSTIITSGSTVTRAADVASITGTNFSSWYNQSEGTVFADTNASGLFRSCWIQCWKFQFMAKGLLLNL